MFGSKYNVAPVARRTVDNITFASKMEMNRYLQLKILLKAGKIKDLQMQPKFELIPAFERNGKHFLPINYVGDFAYHDCETKKRVVEEVKGFETAEWKIKQKLFHYKHNMELRVLKVV